jgi:hypothetical protein
MDPDSSRYSELLALLFQKRKTLAYAYLVVLLVVSSVWIAGHTSLLYKFKPPP